MIQLTWVVDSMLIITSQNNTIENGKEECVRRNEPDQIAKQQLKATNESSPKLENPAPGGGLHMTPQQTIWTISAKKSHLTQKHINEPKT